MYVRKTILIFCLLLQQYSLLYPQYPSQLFDELSMKYAGSKKEQAELLLRKVEKWGKIGKEKCVLDSNFVHLLESDISVTTNQLKIFMENKGIAEQETGGYLESAISMTDRNVTARYFVVHDTSYPIYQNTFPDDMDSLSWTYNNTEKWTRAITHVYVTRTGACNTVTDFSEKLRGTKFEMRAGDNLKGLFLHVELVQPRIYKSNVIPKETRINAPTPPEIGFTDAQYERLALLYICAGVRRGEWLVPALHANIDEGIKDSHDDPQNFDVGKFIEQILQIVAEIQEYGNPQKQEEKTL